MYQSRSINRHRAVTYTAKSLRLSLADNNDQLLLRWLRNVAQCDFFTVEWEYRSLMLFSQVSLRIYQ